MQFKDREHRSNRFASLTAIAVVLVFIVVAGFITTADAVQQTAWALVPPVIAIALALITKEVYSSLFFGILTGALLFSGYHFEGTINHIFVDGIISVLSDSYNVGILCFLVILRVCHQQIVFAVDLRLLQHIKACSAAIFFCKINHLFLIHA